MIINISRLVVATILGSWLVGLSSTAVAQETRPSITAIVNAASYNASDGLAPGSIISIFGSSLSDGTTASATQVPLPTVLANARVLVNGNPAPLFFVSPLQVNAQLPFELSSNATAANVQLEVRRSSSTVTSTTVVIRVSQWSPGIFTRDQTGSGPGVILRPNDPNPICPSGRADCIPNPVRPGEIVTIYVTGLGRLQPTSPPSGTAINEARNTVSRPAVEFGGIQGQVGYSGVAPGYVGLYQINVTVPIGIAPHEEVPVRVNFNNVLSNQTTIPISDPITPLVGGGPAGGLISSLAIARSKPAILYCATATAGIYKSLDGGRTWTAKNNGLPFRFRTIRNLTVSPFDPQITFAVLTGGSEASGVYRTKNGGESWIRVFNVSATQTGDIQFDPVNGSTIYLAYNNNFLQKSVDTGNTWAPTNQVSASLGIGPLAIDPSNPRVMYTGQGGITKSIDGGGTWTPSSSGMSGVRVQALALDPRTSTTLYVGTAANGMFKSTDGAQSWTAINGGIPATTAAMNVTSIAISSVSPGQIFISTAGGLFGSSDAGANWIALGVAAGNTFPTEQVPGFIVTSPQGPETLYTNFNGLSFSDDQGANWRPINSGIAAMKVEKTALAVYPGIFSRIFVGGPSGIFTSQNEGRDWNQVYVDDIRSLAISVSNPSVLYAGNASGRVLRSLDGGASWSLTGSVPTCTISQLSPAILALAIHPSEPNTVLAGCGIQIVRSTDSGDTWTRVTNFGGTVIGGSTSRWVITTNPREPSTMFAAFQNSSLSSGYANFYRSVNGGISWTIQPSLLQQSLVAGIDLAVHSLDSQLVYFGAAFNFLQRSTSGGAEWSSLPLSAIYSIALDPTSRQILFVGRGDVLHRSTNGGQDWEAVYQPPTFSQYIHALVIDPSNPLNMYAGTPAGIYRTADGGLTWEPTSAVLSD